MVEYRKDRFDSGLALARELRLTLNDYSTAMGRTCHGPASMNLPVGWLGGMALKVLRETSPRTFKGWVYSQPELDYFWVRLRHLEPLLESTMAEALRNREPSDELCFAVKNLLNRTGVLTNTGRLRAKATYSARRNTVFQGAAADGAKLALYRLWRAGFTVVAFLHDEVIVEVPINSNLAAVKLHIDGILIDAMKEICPDIRIEVEGAFHRRWSKDKADEIQVALAEA